MILTQFIAICCRESPFHFSLMPKWHVENSFMSPQTFSIPLYKIKKDLKILCPINIYTEWQIFEQWHKPFCNVIIRWKLAERFSGANSTQISELSEKPFLPFWAGLCLMIRAREEKGGFAIFPHNVSERSPHNLWDTSHEMFMKNLGGDTNGSVAPALKQANGVGIDQLR